VRDGYRGEGREGERGSHRGGLSAESVDLSHHCATQRKKEAMREGTEERELRTFVEMSELVLEVA
jgi:hypothetical protein